MGDLFREWLVLGFEYLAVGWLAIFGALSLATIAWFRHRSLFKRRPNHFASVLLVVNNQAPVIEGFLQQVCSIVAGSRSWNIDINVIDEDSADDTPYILQRLWRYLPIKVACWRSGSCGHSAFDLGRFLCDQPVIWVFHLEEQEDAGDYLCVLRKILIGSQENREGAPIIVDNGRR